MELIFRNIISTIIHYRIRSFFRSPIGALNDLLSDVKALLGYYKYKNRIIFVVGLPKSGTTWVENFLYKVPGYCFRPLYGDRRKIVLNELPKNALSNAPRKCYSFYKTHIHPTQSNIEILNRADINKIVIVFRDPRDVVVSRYFYYLKRPPETWEPNAREYSSISRDEGMMHSLGQVVESYLTWINGWLKEAEKHPDKYHVVKYEDLRNDPEDVFKGISDFFSLNLNEQQVFGILKKLEQERDKHKFGGNVGNKTTFRKGVVGDWKNHFNEEMVSKFKAASGDSLIKLGYEKSSDWGLR